MHPARAAILALLLAAPLAACQTPEPPPPPPKPAPRAPTVSSMAVDACENAVLAAFRDSPAHRRHDLSFDAQLRRTVPVRTGILTVTGGGSYANEADRLVRITYTCTYDIKADTAVASSYR